MSDGAIRFDDGAAYEEGMGLYSRLAGEVFLDWLGAAAGWRWVDVGCGNGAFTELLVQRTAPAEVQGIDPSEGQLAFARRRPGAAGAAFGRGEAGALPFEAGRFDAGTMALVLFFVPDPARGLAELRRVVRPGGLVAAYLWDFSVGGLPIEPVRQALGALGMEAATPPSAAVSAMPALRAAFAAAGFVQAETREIAVERPFADFDAYWAAACKVGSMGERIASLPGETAAAVRERTRAGLQAAGRIDGAGAVRAAGLANAIKARVPG